MAAEITKAERNKLRAERHALVAKLRDVDKLSFKEIGDRLGVNSSRAGQLYLEGKNFGEAPAHWTDALPTRVGNVVTSVLGYSVTEEDAYMAVISGALDRAPGLGVVGKKALCEYFKISVTEVHGEVMPRVNLESYVPQKPELHNEIVSEVTSTLDCLFSAWPELLLRSDCGVNDLAHSLGESVARILASRIPAMRGEENKTPMQDIYCLEETRDYLLFAFDQTVRKLREEAEKKPH